VVVLGVIVIGVRKTQASERATRGRTTFAIPQLKAEIVRSPVVDAGKPPSTVAGDATANDGNRKCICNWNPPNASQRTLAL